MKREDNLVADQVYSGWQITIDSITASSWCSLSTVNRKVLEKKNSNSNIILNRLKGYCVHHYICYRHGSLRCVKLTCYYLSVLWYEIRRKTDEWCTIEIAQQYIVGFLSIRTVFFNAEISMMADLHQVVFSLFLPQTATLQEHEGATKMYFAVSSCFCIFGF